MTVHQSCDFFNPLFFSRLETWVQLRGLFSSFFSLDELKRLTYAVHHFSHSQRTVVMCAFENEFIGCGGLQPVVNHLSQSLGDVEKLIVLSPFYVNNDSVKKAVQTKVLKKVCSGRCTESGGGNQWRLYRHEKSSVQRYFLEIPGRFTAAKNPYEYEDSEELCHDALQFCCSVPTILRHLGVVRDIIFHCHDWHTALLSLTSKIAMINTVIYNAKTVLTIHNCYDHALSDQMSKRYFSRPAPCQTVLQNSILFLDAPLATVSDCFAHELMFDPIQKEVFARHLQPYFSLNTPLGITNGPFQVTQSFFSKKVVDQAHQGNMALVLERKRLLRTRCLEYIASHSEREPASNTPEASSSVTKRGVYGRVDCELQDDRTPIFFMSGRLDCQQKGFDVVFHALQRMNSRRPKLIFCPRLISSSSMTAANSTTAAWFDFFTRYTRFMAGDVLMIASPLPKQVYAMLLRGATFLVIPSFYEPFGFATEGLNNGTPVIARATGGLLQQVYMKLQPPAAVQRNALPAKAFGKESADFGDTGILVRESYAAAHYTEEWNTILNATLDERVLIPHYQAMVSAVTEGLRKATAIFRNKRQYAQMIANGITAVGSQRSWKDVACQYQQLYEYM
ncbi:MAG: glycogen/starch synthase [Chitinivibrionales bacterium]|nr:glycogen/starch synthase [Chitinivibrionales bacterium]